MAKLPTGFSAFMMNFSTL